MTLPRLIQNYGGPFVDAEPVNDPTTQQSAALANRSFEDCAQMTRTTTRAWFRFTTTAAGAPVAVTVTAGRSHAGTGSGQFPTLQKTATGTYVGTYAANFVDGLGETEANSYQSAWGAVGGTAFGLVFVGIVGTVITVLVKDAAGALTDLGGTAVVTVFVV